MNAYISHKCTICLGHVANELFNETTKENVIFILDGIYLTLKNIEHFTYKHAQFLSQFLVVEGARETRTRSECHAFS